MPEELHEVRNTAGDNEQNLAHKSNAKKQNGCLRRPYNIAEKRSGRQRRKGKIHPTECRVLENSKER